MIAAAAFFIGCGSASEHATRSPSSPLPYANSSSTSSPLLSSSQSEPVSAPVAVLHIDNVKRVPVVLELMDFYDLEDAIKANKDLEALRLVKRGRVLMISNDSAVIVLENTLDKAKVKIQETGRVGWVKSDWVRAMQQTP
jgi:hypothetical protein